MKHILIVNHNAGSIYHGPNFRSYYVGRALVKQGLRVTIVCSSFSHKLTKLPVFDGDSYEEVVNGVRMIWLKMPKYRSSVTRLWNYVCYARKLRSLDIIIPEHVDTVICSSPPPYWIWSCHKFAKKRKARLIFECRDLWPDVILEMKRTAFLNPAVWLMMIAERSAYRNCDAVVAVNSEAGPTMEERGLAHNKFYAIPNGVTIEENEDKKAILSPKLQAQLPEKGIFRVGYAGSLSRVYGLKYFVEAARQLEKENVQFILAGNGGDEQHLREQAGNLKNVSFVGWVPKTELVAFLQQMDITYAGLLNIRSFAIGSDSTKVFEYMKAERPVIHALGASNSVIRIANAGIHVPPENSNAIVDAVRRLKSLSVAERHRIGQAGLEYLKQNRTYEVLGKQWEGLV